MKKKLGILLVVSAMFVFTACGNSTDISDTGNANAYKEDSNVQIPSFNVEATIEETVLVDQNDLKITATALSYSSYSVDLEITIENNSGSDVSVISGSIGYSCNSVNGYMIDEGYINANVSSGKTAKESASFSIDELEVYGINCIADIQLGFDIQDDTGNHFYSGPVQVKSSIADEYDYSSDTYTEAINNGILSALYDYSVDYFAETELYNQGDIRIISETLVTNTDGEKTIYLEIENDSASMVYGIAEKVSVNGLIVYSGTWSSDAINPGTRRIMDISVSNLLDTSYWEALGISDIGNMTLDFGVKDSDYNYLNSPVEISVDVSEKDSSFDDSGEEIYSGTGVRMISKGLVEDSAESDGDIHMLLLVENTGDETFTIEDSYDSLSMNSFMLDYIMYSAEIPSGKIAIIDVEVDKSSLEENEISKTSEITESEMTFEITDSDYNTIEIKVTISY